MRESLEIPDFIRTINQMAALISALETEIDEQRVDSLCNRSLLIKEIDELKAENGRLHIQVRQLTKGE